MLVSVLSVPEEVVEGWVEDDMAGDGKMVAVGCDAINSFPMSPMTTTKIDYKYLSRPFIVQRRFIIQSSC